MDADTVYQRYQELQHYVGWTDADARRVQAVAARLEPVLPALVEDFYQQIDRNPKARRVITGGEEQITRLKGTLLKWLRDLLHGPYDQEYAQRRWRCGWRHVEIGLEQVYTNVALSRLRRGLLRALEEIAPADHATRQSLGTLLDLDLAIIEDAYQSNYTLRQQASERLATIGKIAGGIAHELRNPLNVINTSIYFLLNARSPTPEKVREHLLRIERHVTLSDNVISALSSFARLPAPVVRPFPGAECARETLELNPPGAAVTIVWEWPDGVPDILADRDQFRIVLGNLLRNANEAMPDGGKLTIAAVDCAGFVEISVTDTGVGIELDQQHRIMEPLYSTKTRGLGLGLAIVQSILEKQGGSLSVESQPGQGSRFTVRLPRGSTANGES